MVLPRISATTIVASYVTMSSMAAIGKDATSVESILDRLEKRLANLEDGSLGLNFPEDQFSDLDPKESPSPTSIKGQTSISASIPEVDNIRNIANAVTKLEKEVDKLAADVQSARQKLVEGSQLDSFVEVNASLKDTAVAAIKSFTAKIDGYEVYGLNDDSGFWMPSQSLPIYAGPLEPGTHRLDVEVRIVLKNREGLPLNREEYRFINRSFDIAVNGKTFKKRMVLEVVPPGTAEQPADLKMVISDL